VALILQNGPEVACCFPMHQRRPRRFQHGHLGDLKRRTEIDHHGMQGGIERTVEPRHRL
jgi:hypothetical protein